jgi:hypothetical protein
MTELELGYGLRRQARLDELLTHIQMHPHDWQRVKKMEAECLSQSSLPLLSSLRLM